MWFILRKKKRKCTNESSDMYLCEIYPNNMLQCRKMKKVKLLGYDSNNCQKHFIENIKFIVK